MSFNEANTVRDGIRDYLKKTGWTYISRKDLPRLETDVFVESQLVEALKKINPEIAKNPEMADEVIHKLRAILLSVQSEGLVRANENFAAWLNGEHSMPFGKNGEHVPVRLVDFNQPENNTYTVTTEYSFSAGSVNKRMDIVLLVNGIPVVIGECKTPVRPSETWFDAAYDINVTYEKTVPALFVPNAFSFATEGKEFYYGAVSTPINEWPPWREEIVNKTPTLNAVISTIRSLLNPPVVLDIVKNFTVFATNRKKQKVKILGRHQQYDATNLIVERVREGKTKKGLIWHFQGSGKSLLMVFAAQKLRVDPVLKSPTVIIVVDRIDLDTQITATFNATEIPNTVVADSRETLKKLLAQDTRKIIITTIYKFADAEGVLNTRDNIIVMVDEAHRTQEGDLGRKMRAALPNAFLFGLTGTPINKIDRNTFWAFGAEEDKQGYLSRYTFEQSIRDKATLPLHFEPHMLNYHINQEAIDEEFARMTDPLSEDDRKELARRAGKKSNFIHGEQRIKDIAAHIARHYQANVEPNGLKAMIVCYDRLACVQYKTALDTLFTPETSDIVMTVASDDPEDWKKRWDRDRDSQEKILDRFRDSNDPFKIVIVTSKLLAGFDAPILQTMYLDKLMKDHTLVQAISRVNRPYPQKSFGLIVDYIGVFDNASKSLTFDEREMAAVIKNLSQLRDQLPGAVETCLDYFPGVNRNIGGYEGLIVAQDCLPTNEIRDNFAADFSVLSRLWEAISPDACLDKHKEDYRWLSQVYESVKPASGNGKLLWHTLGAKTLEIINEHVYVESIEDDLETVILDEKTIAEIVKSQDKKSLKEIEIKITRRLLKHLNNPIFTKLGEKLEKLKHDYELGFLNSLEFLKHLLSLAREVVAAEKEVEPEDERKNAKAALTELFKDYKTDNTPVIVERLVNDIDELVRIVRFEGWQQSTPGTREVKIALRRTLKKYQLHLNEDLFTRAYAYIEQYY
ncbi:MAG: type I restriction endonuclease subunit R [Methanomicrobiales archaeon]